ncbi:MAG: hypothetical protein JO111_19135 [Caulobacteraceae bacterium]|nr:hypothetical protein [Caulobacteraceae bacterium]
MPSSPEPHPSPALPLRKSQWEAFAQAVVAGRTLVDAYEGAGYTRLYGAASHLAAKPAVARRIAWLKAPRDKAAGLDIETAIVRLLDMADAADLLTAAGVRDAREALEDAWRLYTELCRSRAAADN